MNIFRTCEIPFEYSEEIVKLSTMTEYSQSGVPLIFSTTHNGESLAVVNTQLADISLAGADNPFGHPGDAVMERLEKRPGLENIYRTDRCGTIEFTTDNKRLWVKMGK